jgi:N-acetyl-anhydromuramyl-L-alanine amidase AmpD
MDSWHQDRGFKRDANAVKSFNPDLQHIGYHYVIYVSGFVVPCRALSEVGAHASGFNKKSIGICMVGKDKFTVAQWASLRRLVRQLQEEHPEADVLGHRDLSPDKNDDGVIDEQDWLKTCPTFDVQEWLDNNMSPSDEHVLVE